MDKRIIVKQRRGLRVGLDIIAGFLPAEQAPTEFVPDYDFGDHRGPISLLTVKPRRIIYVECVGPHLDTRQQ